ncbi:MAG: nucleoid-associated protein, partial [Abditibacteriota bacterium]|nr:nucleoid-associated protein [Abditibacteriota bacterium]
MLNIEAIEVRKALVHKINYYAEKVELAPADSIPTEGMARYFEEHIRNIINSATVKTGRFESADGTVCVCAGTMLKDAASFYEQSRIMAYWFYNNHENLGDNAVYLAFVQFADLERNRDYIAILKLEPVRSFMLQADRVAFEPISTLPDTAKTVNRGAIIGAYSSGAKYDFIFRNQSQGRGEEPEVGKSWIEGFLEGHAVPTPRQMTQLVVKETEKWLNANQEKLQPREPEVLRETIKTQSRSDEMDVMAAANTSLSDDRMKAEYVDGLLKKGLPQTAFAPDREWAEKHAKKITYVCDYNVTVSGNADAVKELVTIDKSDPSQVSLLIETK